jgi:hypothetical protein
VCSAITGWGWGEPLLDLLPFEEMEQLCGSRGCGGVGVGVCVGVAGRGVCGRVLLGVWTWSPRLCLGPGGYLPFVFCWPCFNYAT